MACFLVPTAEAIVTGVVSKVEKKNEAAVEGKIPFSRKLKWLKNMLWGGAALLAYEHVWHGEVVPWFPFLTAAANPEDAAVRICPAAPEKSLKSHDFEDFFFLYQENRYRCG